VVASGVVECVMTFRYAKFYILGMD
jgi:hypothetical protein